jgi:two-component system chemotaxis response regulator CheB
LPLDLPAAIFIVLHLAPDGTSALPHILQRAGPLPAVHPRDREAIQHGRIYVAPPDHHLLVKRDYIRLAPGPKENGHRPAVDPLFRTAAQTFGRRVVGVVLTGARDDGTAGLVAVKQRGGVAVVQDPDTALYDGMPRSAIENVDDVDYVLPLAEIAPILVRLAHEAVEEEDAAPVSSEMEIEADIAELDREALENSERPGTPSGFTCPECNGVLWELHDGELVRYRCRVGHAYSAESLLEEQSNELEAALWAALDALKQKATLAHRLAVGARTRGHHRAAARFEEQAQEAEQRAEVVRKVLLARETAALAHPAATDQVSSEGEGSKRR